MTPRAYYNENDKFCAQWLYNLMQKNLILPGDIDTRDIRDVRPIDLRGYTQHHFFAGIGGWPLALRSAHWPDHREVWTGSCPCQPFSLAGKRGGFADDRHLWPHWRYLVAIEQPATVFGEQVASAAQWLATVRGDLEALGYAVGAMPVEAASAGADHLRDRYWFVADNGCGRRDGSREGESEQSGRAETIGASIVAERTQQQHRIGAAGTRGWNEYSDSGVVDSARVGRREGRTQHEVWRGRPAATVAGSAVHLADADAEGSQGRIVLSECPGERTPRQDGMADADVFFQSGGELQRGRQQRRAGGDQEARALGNSRSAGSGRNSSIVLGEEEKAQGKMRGIADQLESSSLEWVIGADGKARRVKPGVRLLAHGVPARVAKLRAFGNAIDPRPAAAFITAAIKTLDTP